MIKLFVRLISIGLAGARIASLIGLLRMASFFNYRMHVVKVATSAIGHLAGEQDMLLAEIRECSAFPGSSKYFFVPDKRIANTALYDLWLQQFKATSLPAWLLAGTGMDFALEFFVKRRLYGQPLEKNSILRGDFQYRPLLCDANQNIRIPDQALAGAEAELEELGISASSRLVLIAARDSAYHGEDKVGADSPIRNSDIEKLRGASQELVSRGFTVVRMGAAVSEEISFAGPNVIDYAASGLRSDLLDLVLFSRCHMCISGPSGILELAALFRKPILVTNVSYLLALHVFVNYDKTRILLKRPRDSTTRQIISLAEAFARAPNWWWSSPYMTASHFFLEENSEIEIMEAVIEMLTQLECHYDRGSLWSPNLLQQRFWTYYLDLVPVSYHEPLHSISADSPRAALAQSFIGNNSSWLFG